MQRKLDRRRAPGRRRAGLSWIANLLRRCARGQAIAEFLMAVPVFVILFSGIFEFSRYYTARLRIRSAVAEGARFATTGSFLSDPDTGDPISRPESIKNTILNYAAQFGVTADDITLDPADGGGPEEVVTVTLAYDYDPAITLMENILGPDTLDFQISTAMRNEPFFPEE